MIDSTVLAALVSAGTAAVTSIGTCLALIYRRGNQDGVQEVRMRVVEASLGRIEQKIDALPCHQVICPPPREVVK